MQSGSSPVLARWFAPVLFWSVVAAIILVPFALFADQIDALVRGLMGDGTASFALGAMIVSFLTADIFLPIPSSLIATGSGALFGLLPGAALSTVGLCLGHWVGYLLGQRFGQPALAKLGAPPMAGVSDSHTSSLQLLPVLLVLTRAVPVLAEAMTVAAGIASLPMRYFLAAIVPANLGQSLLFAWFGQQAAQQGSFLLVFAASIGVPVLAWLIYEAYQRLRHRRSQPSNQASSGKSD